MKLYRISTASGTVAWAGTQADAKADAAACQGATWKEEDVPTDKPSLLVFLNANAVNADASPVPGE